MKKTTFFLFFMLGLLSIGCKKDGDGELSCGEKLEGTWRARSLEIDGVQQFGFQGTGGLNFFEMEISEFNPGNNNGELYIAYQRYGEVPASPITGLFSPSVDCNKMDTPNFPGQMYSFINGNSPTLRWDITALDESRLFIEANVEGYGFKLKFDKK